MIWRTITEGCSMLWHWSNLAGYICQLQKIRVVGNYSNFVFIIPVPLFFTVFISLLLLLLLESYFFNILATKVSASALYQIFKSRRQMLFSLKLLVVFWIHTLVLTFFLRFLGIRQTAYPSGLKKILLKYKDKPVQVLLSALRPVHRCSVIPAKTYK